MNQPVSVAMAINRATNAARRPSVTLEVDKRRLRSVPARVGYDEPLDPQVLG
jgi:hypothetical protein